MTAVSFISDFVIKGKGESVGARSQRKQPSPRPLREVFCVPFGIKGTVDSPIAPRGHSEIRSFNSVLDDLQRNCSYPSLLPGYRGPSGLDCSLLSKFLQVGQCCFKEAGGEGGVSKVPSRVCF